MESYMDFSKYGEEKQPEDKIEIKSVKSDIDKENPIFINIDKYKEKKIRPLSVSFAIASE